jgi:IS30 family transposase
VLVAEKLAAGWSPEQIAGWLKRRFADDETGVRGFLCI